MTNWRAVAVGSTAMVGAALLAYVVQGIGYLPMGIVGGLAAGLVDRRGLIRGAWHGLVAGGIVGSAIGLLIVIGTLSPGTIGSIVFGGIATAVLAVPLVMGLGAIAAVCGGIGGVIGEAV